MKLTTRNRTLNLLHANIPPSPLHHYADPVCKNLIIKGAFLNDTAITGDPIPISNLT